MAGQARPALGEGVILTLNARPLFQLKAGPLRFLLGLRKLAGHSRSFETLTCSLAKLFGRCVNTIRTWRNELVEQGYIHWILDRRTGRVTIFVRMAVEPPSCHEELDKLEQRKPGQTQDPRPGSEEIPWISKSSYDKPGMDSLVFSKTYLRNTPCLSMAHLPSLVKTRISITGWIRFSCSLRSCSREQPSGLESSGS